MLSSPQGNRASAACHNSHAHPHGPAAPNINRIERACWLCKHNFRPSPLDGTLPTNCPPPVPPPQKTYFSVNLPSHPLWWAESSGIMRKSPGRDRKHYPGWAASSCHLPSFSGNGQGDAGRRQMGAGRLGASHFPASLLSTTVPWDRPSLGQGQDIKRELGGEAEAWNSSPSNGLTAAGLRPSAQPWSFWCLDPDFQVCAGMNSRISGHSE